MSLMDESLAAEQSRKYLPSCIFSGMHLPTWKYLSEALKEDSGRSMSLLRK